MLDSPCKERVRGLILGGLAAAAVAASGCGGAPDEGESAAANVDAPSTAPPFPGGSIARGVVPGRPNVLVITIDTLRADHLEAYGYPRPTSPRLAAFGEESVVFETAYAPVATTLPSHTSMFTGVYPKEHGVLANIADGRTYQRREDLRTLAELFRDAGYRTGAVVSAFPLSAEFGLDAGFDEYVEAGAKQVIAEKSATRAIKWMRRESKEEAPNFLWLHFFDPHGPYTAPYEYTIKLQPSEEQRAYLDERKFAERAQRPTGQWNELISGVNAYDAEIAYVDREIKRVLNQGQKCGFLEGAIIAVLADHGEGLNQHGVPGHGVVWEEQLRVPMMLRVPGVSPRRLASPVSLVDFAPTLLHVMDLPGTEEFLAQVTGVDRFDPAVRHDEARIMGQSSPRQANGAGLDFILRVDRWKLHMDAAGELQLYNLEEDPFELRNVAEDHPRVVDRLEDELVKWIAAQGSGVRTLEASESVQKDLRSLGYTGGR